MKFLDSHTVEKIILCRGVQKNRITEKTEKTDGKLTEKTEPR
jgi:hypothetical protein